MENQKKAIKNILTYYRQQSENKSSKQRDKGTHFEELCIFFLKNDQRYRYSKVVSYAEWAKQEQKSQKDLGIDLIIEKTIQKDYKTKPKTSGVQCKFIKKKEKITRQMFTNFQSYCCENNLIENIFIDTSTQPLSDDLNQSFDKAGITRLQVWEKWPDSDIDWSDMYQKIITNKNITDKSHQHVAKESRPYQYQKEAVEATIDYFKTHDRGKLIMACGTGKTFVSYQIAKNFINNKHEKNIVLFLAPSLPLIDQILTAYATDAQNDGYQFEALAVCSDSQIGKSKSSVDSDYDELKYKSATLMCPASTNAQTLIKQIKAMADDSFKIIFSTYHSMPVIHEMQKVLHDLNFSLIICDEAHYTASAIINKKNVKNKKSGDKITLQEFGGIYAPIHDATYIRGTKRLYMTATPKIYSESVKNKAKEIEAVELFSMNDEKLFGKTIFEYTFTDAIEGRKNKNNPCLTDYKIRVLAIRRELLPYSWDENQPLDINFWLKINGVYKALLTLMS